MSNNTKKFSWREKYLELTDTFLKPHGGPFAGRTTIFIGAVICFFCFCTIALAIRDGAPVPTIPVVFFVVGIVEIISGLLEFKKQKVYEAEEEQKALEKKGE